MAQTNWRPKLAGTVQDEFSIAKITLKSPSGATPHTLTLPDDNAAGALTNDGSGNLTWEEAGGGGGGMSVSVVTGTTQTAVKSTHYVLTNTGSATTVTLPASPSAGDTLAVSNWTTRADAVLDRNGNKILGAAENLTLDIRSVTAVLVYINSTLGWIFT